MICRRLPTENQMWLTTCTSREVQRHRLQPLQVLRSLGMLLRTLPLALKRSHSIGLPPMLRVPLCINKVQL